ncbi:MAG: hypothetical protein FWG52_06740 [Proteobacteria bacterium]|jgi:hypothetical protein|nr:hypothetical protein [Pseudomonadota bacterium]
MPIRSSIRPAAGQYLFDFNLRAALFEVAELPGRSMAGEPGLEDAVFDAIELRLREAGMVAP